MGTKTNEKVLKNDFNLLLLRGISFLAASAHEEKLFLSPLKYENVLNFLF